MQDIVIRLNPNRRIFSKAKNTIEAEVVTTINLDAGQGFIWDMHLADKESRGGGTNAILLGMPLTDLLFIGKKIEIPLGGIKTIKSGHYYRLTVYLVNGFSQRKKVFDDYTDEEILTSAHVEFLIE